MRELSDEQIEALDFVRRRLVHEWRGRKIPDGFEQIARSYLREYLYEAEAEGKYIEPVDLRLEINRVTGAVSVIPVIRDAEQLKLSIN